MEVPGINYIGGWHFFQDALTKHKKGAKHSISLKKIILAWTISNDIPPTPNNFNVFTIEVF